MNLFSLLMCMGGLKRLNSGRHGACSQTSIPPKFASEIKARHAGGKIAYNSDMNARRTLCGLKFLVWYR